MDIAGVKNVGNKYVDEIEIVVIEVKDERITLRHIEQAYGYSLFAHKCYLATPHRITDKNRSDAHRFGVGLLQIDEEKDLMGELGEINGPFYRVEEVLSPQRENPKSRSEMIKFLDTLSIIQCCICHCYVFYWAASEKRQRTIAKLIRGKQISGLSFAAFEPFKHKPKSARYRIHRYICLDCAKELSPILKKYDAEERTRRLEIKDMKKRIQLTEKKLAELNKTLRKVLKQD